jgi:hypothetical protein
MTMTVAEYSAPICSEHIADRRAALFHESTLDWIKRCTFGALWPLRPARIGILPGLWSAMIEDLLTQDRGLPDPRAVRNNPPGWPASCMTFRRIHWSPPTDAAFIRLAMSGRSSCGHRRIGGFCRYLNCASPAEAGSAAPPGELPLTATLKASLPVARAVAPGAGI